MKRLDDKLFEKMVSIESIIIADEITRKKIMPTYSLKKWDKHWYENVEKLHADLASGFYIHGPYRQFERVENGKMRPISVCSYRDRIGHTLIIEALGDFFRSKFTADSYASVPRMGSHKAVYKLRSIMKKNKSKELYAYMVDVVKFYDSVDHQSLMDAMKRYIKESRTLGLLYQIIISLKGLSIGSLTSPWFGNLLLSQMDHLAKEQWGAVHYFRYCDNLLILSDDKNKLYDIKDKVEEHISGINMKLHPWSLFKVGDKKGNGRGVDFVGYVFYRNHTLLRKKTKERWRRRLIRLDGQERDVNKQDLIARATLVGLFKPCNSKNLQKTFKNEYKNIGERLRKFDAA